MDTFQKGLYQQVDSPQPNLRRDSAELFVKEVVPPLQLSLVRWPSYFFIFENVWAQLLHLMVLVLVLLMNLILHKIMYI